MQVILGSTGHIGSALVPLLLERQQAVTVVARSAERVALWRDRGAHVAVADIHDTPALHAALRRGSRAYLVNPPADCALDTDREERATVRSIVSALQGTNLELVVAQSTYGAQSGEHIADLGSLFELERGVAAQSTPYQIIRAAYYMSNWDAQLESARSEGVLRSFYPPDFALPMVAPADIAQVAARLLTEPPTSSTISNVEGPARYTSADVAAAFSQALGKTVQAVYIPKSERLAALQKLGFSSAAADSFSAMTELTLNARFPAIGETTRGTTTLADYVAVLCARRPSG